MRKSLVVAAGVLLVSVVAVGVFLASVDRNADVHVFWRDTHRDAGYRLVTHRQSLSKYVDTAKLPRSFLDRLDAGASRNRDEDGDAVQLRQEVGGPEPTLKTILGHIAQLQPFFTANADVIAAGRPGWVE